MLVERGLQVLNVEVVGDAYAIAANYLRRTGAIAHNLATSEPLLEIIVQLFQRGEIQPDSPRQQGDRQIRIRNHRISLTGSTEDCMEPAIDRIMMTYDLLLNRTAAASAEARVKVTDYLATLVEAGEKDTHRLTVCGLTYLRELDGSSDPVKAGFTGL